MSFGKLFFLVNLPFYWFAWRRMGREFTLKTFLAVDLLALLTEWSPQMVDIAEIQPLYAALVGGLQLGTGALFLARHRASLGGATIDRVAIPAGEARPARRPGANGHRRLRGVAGAVGGAARPRGLVRAGGRADEPVFVGQTQTGALHGDVFNTPATPKLQI